MNNWKQEKIEEFMDKWSGKEFSDDGLGINGVLVTNWVKKALSEAEERVHQAGLKVCNGDDDCIDNWNDMFQALNKDNE